MFVKKVTSIEFLWKSFQWNSADTCTQTDRHTDTQTYMTS